METNTTTKIYFMTKFSPQLINNLDIIGRVTFYLFFRIIMSHLYFFMSQNECLFRIPIQYL